MVDIRQEPLPISRASHYGDGVFETMRINQAGEIVLLPAHLERFCSGLRCLGLDVPELEALHGAVAKLAQANPAKALKLVGFASAENLGYGRISSGCELRFHVFELPPIDSANGLRLAVSSVHVSAQVALQGAKTLNRIDQVLAANALAREHSNADEALMFTPDNQLCCAISGNIFFHAGGRWHTPELARYGVRGVMRRTLLTLCKQRQIDVNVSSFYLADLAQAQEVILCNALRGIRPVGVLEDVAHPLSFDPQGPNTQKLIEWVAALGFYA